MNIKIENDVFDIANRIKNIDRKYVIYFNTTKNQFEVHNLSQKQDTYCLRVPYPVLDDRTLKLTRQTSGANIKIILNQIEIDNELVENAEKRSALNKFNDRLEQLIKENQ